MWGLPVCVDAVNRGEGENCSPAFVNVVILGTGENSHPTRNEPSSRQREKPTSGKERQQRGYRATRLNHLVLHRSEGSGELIPGIGRHILLPKLIPLRIS